MSFVVEFPFLSGWNFSWRHKRLDKIRERNFKEERWLKLWKEGVLLFKLFENKDCVTVIPCLQMPWYLADAVLGIWEEPLLWLFSHLAFARPKTFRLHVLTALTQTLRPDAEPWTPLCPPPQWVWEPQIGFGRKSNGICHSRLLVVPFSFEFECNMKLASRHFCTHFTDEKCGTQQY